MYDFWYDYVKPNYGEREKTKLYYMFTYSFIVYMKTDRYCKDVETRLDTSNKL